MNCVAPKCLRPAVTLAFCAECSQAPAVQRGGWLSAHRRRTDMVKIDASQVAPKLWVGSAPKLELDLPKIDVLVLCAREIQPARLAFHGTVLRCPLPDSQLTNDEIRLALHTSREVARALSADKRVLSTCAMGINRSALVAGLALGQVTRMSSSQIIDRIRAKRLPSCLGNAHFRELLEQMVDRPRIVAIERRRSHR